MRTVREGLLKANSIWSERAWVLVGALLFAGTVTCWLYGDRHEHYNGFLVLLGWTCLAIGVCVYRIRPSAPRMFISGGWPALGVHARCIASAEDSA